MASIRRRLAGNRAHRSILGLLLGGLLLAGYFGLVGFEDVRRVLTTVPPRRIASLLLVGFVPLVFWGGGLYLVLDRLGRRVRPWNAVTLFAASGFLNSVTPFGQIGGDPVTAVLYTRAIGTDFETGLAAIGSLNALNRIATVFLGLLGVGYLWSRVAGGTALLDSIALVAGLAIAVTVGLVVGWENRHRIVDRLAAAITPLLGAASRLVPGTSPPTRGEVERRGQRFIVAIDRLATDPRRLALVFGLSVAGQLAVASTLWVALVALESEASLAVVLLIIPIAKLGGLAPTPGGFGTAQTLLAILLVWTTGVGTAVAGAAVLLYRASAFWLPALVGGLVTGWFVAVGDVGETDVDRGGPIGGGHDGAVSYAREGSTVSRTRSPVPRILIALAVSLAVLVAVVLHRRHLVIEPANVVVHVTRDASLVVLSFGLTWAILSRFSRDLSG